MNIKQQLKDENKKLADKWKVKRKIGLKKYIIMGMFRCLLFLNTAYLLKYLIKRRIGLDTTDILILLVGSILLPIISWFGNEIRYRQFYNK